FMYKGNVAVAQYIDLLELGFIILSGRSECDCRYSRTWLGFDEGCIGDDIADPLFLVGYRHGYQCPQAAGQQKVHNPEGPSQQVLPQPRLSTIQTDYLDFHGALTHALPVEKELAY